MQLTELAVQNVIGFPPATRLMLRQGLNALVTGEADALRVVRAVLFPDPVDATALCTGPGPHKAAVTIVGRDGQTYRIIRDFAGGRSLLRSDPQTRQAVRLSDDPAEITHLLRTAIGLPSEEIFLGHLLLTADRLPSRQKQRVAPVAPPPAIAGEEVPTFSPEQARARLPELRLELEQSERFEREQDHVFALQAQHAELSQGTEALEQIQRQIAHLEDRLRVYQTAFDGTKGAAAHGSTRQNIEQRIRKFPEAAARRESALAELEKKKQELAAILKAIPGIAELVRDRLVAGGLLVGVLATVAAFVFGIRSLLLVDVVAFTVAAFGAWKWVDRVEDGDRSRRKTSEIEELGKRIQQQYEADTKPVYAAMQALGVGSAEEVLHALEERDMLETRRHAFLRELENRRLDPELAAREQQRIAVENELEQRQQRIQALGIARDLGSIRRELFACEEALGMAGAGADVLAVACDRAALLAGVPLTSLLDGVKERLRQYLSALTGKRFAGLRLVPSGVHVVAATGASGPLSGLPPADQDAIALAVNLALFERVGATSKLPLLVDDPSRLADVAHRGLLVKMLRSLGALTQVVVRALEEPPAGAVDHVSTYSNAHTPPPTTTSNVA